MRGLISSQAARERERAVTGKGKQPDLQQGCLTSLKSEWKELCPGEREDGRGRLLTLSRRTEWESEAGLRLPVRWTTPLAQWEGGHQWLGLPRAAAPMSPGPLVFGRRDEVRPYLDACTPALAHSVGHGSPWRVNHGHEPHEAELLRGKVQLVRVKFEAPRKLSRGQIQLTKA